MQKNVEKMSIIYSPNFDTKKRSSLNIKYLIFHYTGMTSENAAIRRLKFDEHFFLQLLVALRKKNIKRLGSKALLDIGPYFNDIIQKLEFNLTKAQKNVVQEIHSDLKMSIPMNRLVQGDYD